MSVKAKLKVILRANDTVVAESDDAQLWQRVLIAINSANAAEGLKTTSSTVEGEMAALDTGRALAGSPINNYAKELDIPVNVLQGACAPSTEAPYIHLDIHHWEALRKILPERGTKSIPDIIVAATLLVLWKRHADLGRESTIKEAGAILRTIGLSAKNPLRSIKNCEWLQVRGEDKIILNPAQSSKAVGIVKAYCLKKDPYAKET